MDPESLPAADLIPFVGVVLAGGRSTRMGRDKAGLMVDGERLLDRQVRLLREAGAGRVLLSLAGSSAGETPSLPAGTEIVVDRRPSSGPLAGIEAALRSAQGHAVMVLAVDLPGLRAGHLRRLRDLSALDRGVVPVHGGVQETLAALYPAVALEEAARRLDSGRLRVLELVQAGLDAGWMRCWEIPEADIAAWVNWNHPGDWPPD
jgi:molybdopterin-guanine dinucleotide biosynthesis protein A